MNATLDSDAAQIWLIDLDAPFEPAHLSVEERARGASIQRPRAARRWCAARAGLREILARYTGQAPGKVPLKERGAQPAAAGLCFSVSHSGDLAAVALAKRPIGIDVECNRPLRDPVRLAAGLGEEPRWRVAGHPAHQRNRAFLREWTRAEATFKLGVEDPWLGDLDLLGAAGALAAPTPLEAQIGSWTQRSNTPTTGEAPERYG
jgi:4'-phosphopantetheinyl transferase